MVGKQLAGDQWRREEGGEEVSQQRARDLCREQVRERAAADEPRLTSDPAHSRQEVSTTPERERDRERERESLHQH